jgi:hypothetical protein
MDSQGLSLIFILDLLNNENCLVDWVDFIDYTIEKKWNTTQTFSKIEEALVDVFGRDYTEQILLRLRYYLTKKYS